MKAIEYGDEVTIALADESIEVERALVTVPLGFLRSGSIAANPPLPLRWYGGQSYWRYVPIRHDSSRGTTL